MSSTAPDPRLDALCDEEIVRPRVAPAAALAVAVRRNEWELLAGACGRRSLEESDGDGGPRGGVRPDSPFDLASVTKPFTAAAAARLHRTGAIDLDAPLQAYVEEARDTPMGSAPLDLLLAHRAGLRAHLDLFAPLMRGEPFDPRGALRAAACARRPGCEGPAPKDGFPPLYSDLGYLLVGEAIGRATGQPLDRVVEREVSEPLGLSVRSARSWRTASPGFDRSVVATEHVRWRGGELRGVVHDENAWAFAREGVAGHAGLFGTAPAVARFGAALLESLAGRDRSWLRREDLLRLVAKRPGGTLRAGFDGRSGSNAASGRWFGARTFGHLGFTGTSIWCDPDAEIALALLTNRVCPSRDHVTIRTARPRIHDRLLELLRASRAPDSE